MNPQTILTNNLWPSWSKAIASPADPFENSPAAVERLMKKLAPYFEEVKGVRPQFHARNSTQLITFQSDTERVFYQSAWDRYLEAVSKMDQVDMKARGFMLLVQFLKFRMAAEICRSSNVASAMFDCVNKHNQAAVYACNFQHSIAKTIKFLHEIYKVPRSKISIIWGGSEAFTMKEEDYLTNKQISTILVEAMAGKAIENRILKQMTMQFRNQENNIGDVSNLDLGKQSRKDRQREIDKFQSGDSLYCFYTFKSGGVGLSLHHTDEMTEVKCHRRESGYVYEEDIPLIPTRQRVTFLSPTYSAIELVQGLGRVPRLTSLSDTSQTILFYAGTIEERVAAVVSSKLRCLKKVVQQRESWEDAILDNERRAKYDNELKLLQETTGNEEAEESPQGLYLEDEDDET